MNHTQKQVQAERQRAQKRLADSHLHLLKNAEFRTHLAWLADELLDQRDVNESLSGEALLRGLGEAVRLKKILKTVDDSGAVMIKTRLAEQKRVQGLEQKGAY
jgi:hypothetical protein